MTQSFNPFSVVLLLRLRQFFSQMHLCSETIFATSVEVLTIWGAISRVQNLTSCLGLIMTQCVNRLMTSWIDYFQPTVPLQDLPATTSTATSSSKKSSRVQTVLWTPCKMLTINESMLDLLVKLHSKMVGKEGSYLPPSMRTEKGERNDQERQVK